MNSADSVVTDLEDWYLPACRKLADHSKSILSAMRIEAPFGKSRPRRLSLKTGLRYERACLQAVKNSVDLEVGVLAGPWIQYQRRSGERNICQPDIVLLEPGLVVVIECKNTWVETAWEQIELYREVCAVMYRRKAIGFQMCKNVTPRTRERICRNLNPAIDLALLGHTVTLHWPGKGSI